MLRKTAIGLAAATFAMGGSALSASTVHGGSGAQSAGKVSGSGGQHGGARGSSNFIRCPPGFQLSVNGKVCVDNEEHEREIERNRR